MLCGSSQKKKKTETRRGGLPPWLSPHPPFTTVGIMGLPHPHLGCHCVPGQRLWIRGLSGPHTDVALNMWGSNVLPWPPHRLPCAAGLAHQGHTIPNTDPLGLFTDAGLGLPFCSTYASISGHGRCDSDAEIKAPSSPNLNAKGEPGPRLTLPANPHPQECVGASAERIQKAGRSSRTLFGPQLLRHPSAQGEVLGADLTPWTGPEELDEGRESLSTGWENHMKQKAMTCRLQIQVYPSIGATKAHPGLSCPFP